MFSSEWEIGFFSTDTFSVVDADDERSSAAGILETVKAVPTVEVQETQTVNSYGWVLTFLFEEDT